MSADYPDHSPQGLFLVRMAIDKGDSWRPPKKARSTYGIYRAFLVSMVLASDVAHLSTVFLPLLDSTAIASYALL
jgi:hypothetical protein